MLLPDETTQDDLRSAAGPWHPLLARPRGKPLEADLRCDVAVIGGGITGALVAEHLVSLGRDVVVVDREREGFGSTAASTAMLQWEIDMPLRRLSELYGFERAADVYRRSLRAVEGLGALAARLRIPCAYYPRDTVYLAAGEVGSAELREEHELRSRAGLPGALLDHGALLSHFGFDREAAIVSPGSAEADPLALCHAMLSKAVAEGARLVRDEAVRYDQTAHSAAVVLDSGRTIEAGHIVLATGYVMPDCVESAVHQIASSFALATPRQQPAALWPGRALVWEASENYFYTRTTAHDRIVIGGEDEDMDDADAREALEPEKSATLLRKLSALLPAADASAELVWSGVFGKTVDGLPLIGRVPGHPRLLAAYGYGGNGITFSYLASRLIASLVEGRESEWFGAFAIDRPDPR